MRMIFLSVCEHAAPGHNSKFYCTDSTESHRLNNSDTDLADTVLEILFDDDEDTDTAGTSGP